MNGRPLCSDSFWLLLPCVLQLQSLAAKVAKQQQEAARGADLRLITRQMNMANEIIIAL